MFWFQNDSKRQYSNEKKKKLKFNRRIKGRKTTHERLAQWKMNETFENEIGKFVEKYRICHTEIFKNIFSSIYFRIELNNGEGNICNCSQTADKEL